MDLIPRLESALARRLVSGRLLDIRTAYGGAGEELGGMRSLGEFVSCIAAHAACRGEAPVQDMTITLSELLRNPMAVGGRQGTTVRDVAQALVIAPMLETLLSDIHPQIHRPNLTMAIAKAFDGWAKQPFASREGRLVVEKLVHALEKNAGNQQLRSFFVKDPKHGELLRWSGSDVTASPSTVLTPFGNVEVRVSKYHTENLPVSAYEWEAKIFKGRRNRPVAVACGTVYTFKSAQRNRGTVGTAADLVDAADLISDLDVNLVRSFLELWRYDAAPIGDCGDLCFVSLWERQPQLPTGSGLACLQAGLKVMRRRFRNLRGVIIPVEPYQFRCMDAEVVRPPQIEAEYLEAHDRLLGYCETLQERIGMDVAVRLTGARSMGPEATLAFVSGCDS